MAFFGKVFRAALNVLSPIRSSDTNRSIHVSAKRSLDAAFAQDDSTVDSPLLKKKRTKHNNDLAAEINHEQNSVQCLEQVLGPSEVSSRLTGSTIGTSATHSRLQSDRALMPPPSKPTNPAGEQRKKQHKAHRVSLDLSESASQATRSSRAGRNEVQDEYDMEEARRKAAATQLPPNSGIWETAERELFFHLSYRGFEPLLPSNWMIDFPTLPLAIFASQEGDEALITCHRSTEFRAIRALRELIDTGRSIRDRTVSSSNLHRDLRAEPIMEKAVSRYISWALKDQGFSDQASSKNIPVHTIATLRSGSTTDSVIRKLATEMHILAAQHRVAVETSESDEPDTTAEPRHDGEATRIPKNADLNEQSLPVVYGLMIASSVLAIFTLNCHMPFPQHLLRALLQEGESDTDSRSDRMISTPRKLRTLRPHLAAQLEAAVTEEEENAPAGAEDEDSGIRYIASFDFSDAAADVWNAFVVAIVAMQIRKTQLEVHVGDDISLDDADE